MPLPPWMPAAWRSFNLVLADRAGAFFVRGLGHGHPEAQTLAPGLHMVTAHDPDDIESPRVARHLPRFRAAQAARAGRLGGLAGHPGRPLGSAGEQINVVPRGGFGTVCSSLLALPAAGPPIWLFAAGPPDRTDFLPVT